MKYYKVYLGLVLMMFAMLARGQERIAEFSFMDLGTVTMSDPSNLTRSNLTDKCDTTFFMVDNTEGDYWIQLELEFALVLTSYTMVSTYKNELDPTQWRMEYSDDGNNWTELHSVAKVFPSANFPLNNSTGLHGSGTGHRYYRLVIENGGLNGSWGLAQLQMFGCRQHFEENITSNGGTLTGEYEGLIAFGETLEKLTDNSYKKFCQTNTRSFWVEYESPEPILLEKYGITTAFSSGRMPRTWRILGSNNGVDWNLLDEQVNRNMFEATYATQYYEIGSTHTKELDWAKNADCLYNALVDGYWRPYSKGGKYFIQKNGVEPHMGYNYWWMAHALDVLVDRYNRTGDVQYVDKMDDLMDSFYAYGNGSLWNTFYDDMEWMGLACIRAYDATGEVRYKQAAINLWNWIKNGWSEGAETNYGGIDWSTGTPGSKNACSNAPAIILSARLYKMTGVEDYLDWSKKIYNWTYYNLVDTQTGYVWDGLNNHNIGNVYSYNIGTWIGGGLELYLITGENKYLERAIVSADCVVNDTKKFSPFGVLYNGENGGDGGLFKGIFMRYLSQLILYGGLEESVHNRYVNYFKENAATVWNAATMKPEMIVSKKWYERPDGPYQDCSIQLSGVMLFELIDELDRNGEKVHFNATDDSNLENSYRFFRLEMRVNNGAGDSEMSEWQLFGSTTTGDEKVVIVGNTVKIVNDLSGIRLIPNDEMGYFYRVLDVSGNLYKQGKAAGTVSLTLPGRGVFIVQVIKEGESFTRKVIN